MTHRKFRKEKEINKPIEIAELPGLSKRSQSLPGQCLSEITKDPPCFVSALYSQNLRYRQSEKVRNTLSETPSGAAVVVRLAAYHAHSLWHCRCTQLIATSKWYEVTKLKVFPPNFFQLPSFRNIPTEACRASAFAKDDCVETIRHRCVPNYGALKYSFVSHKYLGCPQFEFDDWRMSTFCWGLCHYAGSGCPVQADECPSQYVERKLF